MAAYSLDSYRVVLETALASGYVFVPFGDVGDHDETKRIFLRHDVDYSLEMALELAKANAQLGVRGTFCVLLRSQIYNVLSSISMELVAEIHGLGQSVGLHTPLSGDDTEADALDGSLKRDFEFLRANLPLVSPICSWHNPAPDRIAQYLNSPGVGGLVNTYSAAFIRRVPYYSDSNMRHSVDTWTRLVGREGAPVLHLLFHPLYWVAGGTSMSEVFARTWPYLIREREHGLRSNQFYAETLPDGMPLAILERFGETWRRAAEKGAA